MNIEIDAGSVHAYTGGRRFDPSLPGVVLVHGAQGDHSVWALQSRYLAHHGYAVLALDLPGHGRTQGPAAVSVEAYADRVAAAVRASGLARVLLAGHSMGSLIALEAARRLGDGVAGVALVGTGFPMKVSDTLLAATREYPADAMDMINLWSFGASIVPFTGRLPGAGPGSNVIWQNLRLMQRVADRHGRETLSRDFTACNAYTSGLDAVAALRCPLLFVLGAQDLMTPPRMAQPLVAAAAVPASTELIEVKGAGHALLAEAPDLVRVALTRFATRCFASSS